MIINVPDEIKNTCPKFFQITLNQKKIFWAYFIQSIAVAESSLNPKDRFKEPGNSIDSVTGRPVYSEGLLQLSYQDKYNHIGCDFDWSKDKLLDPSDERKTILDPKTNLKCGVSILNKQLIKRGQIFTQPSHYYWSVLNPVKNPEGFKKVNSQLTVTLEFCK